MITIDQARKWYPDSDPVHGFDHVLRVLAMAEQLGKSVNADLEIIHAAVLLHDAQPPLDDQGSNHEQDRRKDHHLSSSEFAGEVLKKEGWPVERIEAVQHCIRAHRFRDDREQHQSLEAKILFDADKLDAIGAIGVARAVAYAARLGQPAYAKPSSYFLETGQTEPGEPHSAYHEYLFKLRHLDQRLYTPPAQQIGAQRRQYLDLFFEQLAEEINHQR